MSEPYPYEPAAGPAPTSQQRNWALAAHLGAFVAAYLALGLLAPLVVLLVKGDESPFVRRHAVESLNFQITTLLWAVAATVATIATLGVGLIVVLPLAGAYVIFYLVVVILGGVRAAGGAEFRYPLSWRLVR